MIHFCGHIAALHVFSAGFSLNRESRRHWQPGVCHLGQASPFAAQVIFHLAVSVGFAVAEKVNVLDRAHGGLLFMRFRQCVSAHVFFLFES